MVTIPRAEQVIRQPAITGRQGAARPFVRAPRDLIGRAAERAAITTGRAAQQATAAATGALVSVADTLNTMQERDRLEQLKATKFDMQSQLVEFETQQILRARDTLEQGPEGAFGYTTRVTEDFTQSAREFLKGVPDPFKPEFDAKLHQIKQSLILSADKRERTTRVDFYTRRIDTGLQTLVTQYMDGNIEYHDMAARGKELIRTADIPQDMQQTVYDTWRKETAARKWERLYRENPEKAIVALGAGTPAQKLNAQKDKLFAAMVSVESSGDPNAVSPVGAVGLMQVRPSTARDIAKALRDPSFPAKGSDAEITEYLKQPEISMAYGQYYMNLQLRNFNNDLEAALIAYNAGPDNAKKWLKADRNYAVLPKPQETKPYVQAIMAQMGAEPTQTYVFGKKFVTAGEFRSRNYSWANLRNNRFRDAKMDASAVAALDDVTDAFGRGPLRITSGYRSHEHNSKVSFTKRSRHVEGDAFDIDVSGYSDEEKARLLALFVSAGARGLGHYDDDTIHVDFRPGEGKGPGGLALWYGENRDYTKGEPWFQAGVQQGLATEGRAMVAVRGGPTDPEYNLLSWDERQKMVLTAQAGLKTQRTTKQNEAVDNYKLAMLYAPQSIDETDILNDDRIYDNGVKASVITALRTAKKAGMELAAFQSLITAGGKANPFDAKHRGFVNTMWEQMEMAPDNPQYGAQAVEMTRLTGIAPQAITHNTRRALASDWQDQGAVGTASAQLGVASRILAGTPDAFLGQDGATQIRKAVAAYDRFTYLGFSPTEATQKVLRSEDKQEVAQTKDLRKQAKENAGKLTIRTIAQVFDDVFGPGGEPIVGFGDPRRQALLLSEYRQIYEEEFIDSGDADIASARTDERFKRIYGVTQFSGDDYLMRYPPEKAGYPKINGSYDYIQQQAVESIQAIAGERIKPRQVVFISVPGVTDADIEAGRSARYGIMYQDTEGVWQTSPGLSYFTPDVARAVAEDNQKIRVTPEQEAFFQAELDQRFEPVTRTDIVMQLLDGEVTGGFFEQAAGGITLDTGETLIRAMPAKSPTPVIIDPVTRVIYNYDEETGAFTPTDQRYTRSVIVRPSGAVYSPVFARKGLTPENWKNLVEQQLKARNQQLQVQRTEAATIEEQRRRELTPEQKALEERVLQEYQDRQTTGKGYPTVRGIAAPRDIRTLDRIREEPPVPPPFGIR